MFAGSIGRAKGTGDNDLRHCRLNRGRTAVGYHFYNAVMVRLILSRLSPPCGADCRRARPDPSTISASGHRAAAEIGNHAATRPCRRHQAHGRASIRMRPGATLGVTVSRVLSSSSARRRARPALLPVRRDRELRRAGGLLQNADRRERRSRVQGPADAHVHRRDTGAISGGNDGVSAERHGEGLGERWIGRLRESEDRCAAVTLPDGDHDRPGACGHCGRTLNR